MIENQIKRINQLSELQSGWGGENTEPLTKEAIKVAYDMVYFLYELGFKIKAINPTYDGYILIELCEKGGVISLIDIFKDGFFGAATATVNKKPKI